MLACSYFTVTTFERFLSRVRQDLIHPLVNRTRLDTCSLGNHAMVLGRRSEGQSARIRLIRLDTVFFAPLKVIVDGSPKGGFQFFGRAASEMNNVLNAVYCSMKQFIIALIPDGRGISFEGLHGATPAVSRKRRKETTAPLSISGFGCGLWSVMRNVPFLMRTREPAPSLRVKSNAASIASTSFHLIPARSGLAKIVSSVFRCFDATMRHVLSDTFFGVGTSCHPSFSEHNLISKFDIVKNGAHS